ncbi:small-conductance mechanosensitive channel [Xenococcus sp. PCC 7305]|uniref:mechanosensitive ion channel domain-containing protein n=1 Tax=Xenococcus sp. PCC 7305 TaxID=102125 RepID=UPI0002ABEFBF|nr:mechanosensitive ion channel domain-containing protein [Xenococcus sp. PCC 7305]ELS00970.1 small-conductance mechanosensitive channel [Xenococcus sp. PCC 7305]
MKTSNLILVGLTGLLLFVYSFLRSNPDLVSNSIVKFLGVAVLICGSIAIVNFLSFIIVNLWFVRFQGKQASDLVKLVVLLFLYGICAIIIFQLFGQDITALFATSALITAVVGFALQSTLGNFFSGVALQIDQPFHIGDRVIIQDDEGSVVSITWRATTIQTREGILVQIPNGLMSEEVVKVIPGQGNIQRSIDFLVSGQVHPQKVIDTVYHAILNQSHPNINLDKPVQVSMWNFELAEESLFINYRIFYYPRNYEAAEQYSDRDILRRVWYALNRHGMNSEDQVASSDQRLRLISSIEFFRNLSPEVHQIILRHATSLLFDTGETLTSYNLPEKTMFIVSQGYVNVQQELRLVPGQTKFQVFTRRPKTHPPIPLERQFVERVAFELAQYIGPTAFSLAHEKRVASLYSLYQQLAEEILDLEQRETFLQSCPAAPLEQLQSGDCFGERSLFFSEPLVRATMITAVETELLAIPQEAIAKVLDHDPRLLDVIAHDFARYQSEYLTKTMQIPGAKSQKAEQIAIAIGNL